ncbi:hypothetical protein CAPTEDRAFT_109301, partial [Capitella teleta]
KALDCSPTNRERELGLDRRETVVAPAILLSTRGTAGSDIWSSACLKRHRRQATVREIMTERL